MTAEIVEDHDVAGLQSWRQKLLDIGKESDGIYRAVEDGRCVDPIVAKCGEEGQRFPMAVRHFGSEPLPLRAPTVSARHVGLGPGFINKDQALRFQFPLVGLPTLAFACDVRPILFTGQNAFF